MADALGGHGAGGQDQRDEEHAGPGVDGDLLAGGPLEDIAVLEEQLDRPAGEVRPHGPGGERFPAGVLHSGDQMPGFVQDPVVHVRVLKSRLVLGQQAGEPHAGGQSDAGPPVGSVADAVERRRLHRQRLELAALPLVELVDRGKLLGEADGLLFDLDQSLETGAAKEVGVLGEQAGFLADLQDLAGDEQVFVRRQGETRAVRVVEHGQQLAEGLLVERGIRGIVLHPAQQEQPGIGDQGQAAGIAGLRQRTEGRPQPALRDGLVDPASLASDRDLPM